MLRSGHFEFQMRGLIVRGLEPIFNNSGTGGRIRKFSEDPTLTEDNREISVISVPDLALADRLLKIDIGRHKTENTRDKGR